jgi:hypothetical protein
MVPVLDINKVPMMPCSEKRARKFMDKKEAKPYWQHGIFCIMLLKEPSNRNYQKVVAGIDPGSKREGYTVVTEKKVILNVTTDTPYWVKDKVETRRTLRRTRRQRKTPYRACRNNRSSLRRINRLPPSTKARWDAKLRILNILSKLFRITDINVEDIQAMTRKGKSKWNISFSPLQTGKNSFYNKIKEIYPKVNLVLTEGYNTKLHRDKRSFFKSKAKLDYIWDRHNVDSHSLCEMALNKEIKPYKGMYKIEFMQFHRRQLHMKQPLKGNARKQYGGTVSLGYSRGSILRYKRDNKIYYLGGTGVTRKNKIAIHSVVTGKRIKQHTNLSDIEIMYNNTIRTQFLPSLKKWASLCTLG